MGAKNTTLRHSGMNCHLIFFMSPLSLLLEPVFGKS